VAWITTLPINRSPPNRIDLDVREELTVADDGEVEQITVVPDPSFEDWVAPHRSAMHHLASRLAPPADVDDVVQDALSSAWQKREQFNPGRGELRSWLLAITANQARRLYRARRETDELPADLAANAEPDADLELRAAIAELPVRQREAIELHYYVGLSVKETAELMSCRVGTVKATLHAARRKLLQRLDGEPDG
jgi:RNA polymerase sigma-70 factor (ECF subfamily)